MTDLRLIDAPDEKNEKIKSGSGVSNLEPDLSENIENYLAII